MAGAHEELKKQVYLTEARYNREVKSNALKDSKIRKLTKKVEKLTNELGATDRNMRRYMDTKTAASAIVNSQARKKSLTNKKPSVVKKKNNVSMKEPMGQISVKALSLKQLREVLSDIYASKARFDKNCKEQN